MNFSAEIAALKRRVEALEAGTPAAIEARRQREAAEEKQRQREVAENTRRQQEQHQANELQRLENWKAHEAAEEAARQANQGRFKDRCGMWRGNDGKQLSTSEAAIAAEADRKWKEENK